MITALTILILLAGLACLFAPTTGVRIRLGAFAMSWLPVTATLYGEHHTWGPITIIRPRK